MISKVVNVQLSKYDVYIGRMPQYGNTKWGNPFKIGVDGSRLEVISKYEKWIQTQPVFNDIHELRDKILGCHCSPKPCHGDVLLKLANNLIDW